jgi:hypothetical protein
MQRVRQRHISRQTTPNMLQCVVHSKHGYGWDRTHFDGLTGARTWCGFGVLAHNTVKIAGLIDTQDDARPSRTDAERPSPEPTATGPPGTAPSMSAP